MLKIEVIHRLEHGDADPTLVKILRVLTDWRTHMSAEVDELKRVATKISDTAEAAEATMRGLAATLAANADDPAKIRAIASELDADADKLAAAIVSTTGPVA